MHIAALLLDFRETVSSHPVFGLGVLLTGSWFLGRLVEKRGIPSVTGFILAGMLLGPQVTGMVHADLYTRLTSVTQIAVAVIAVVIGSEFNLARLRRIRRAIATITVAQLAFTFVLVSAAMAVTGAVPPPMAALLGAIATATSPTATVTIVRDLKASGSFIDHLYGAIPLDDAGCVFLFAVVTALVGGFMSPGDFTAIQSILHFSVEMGGSLALGLGAGMALKRLTAGRERPNAVYIISLGLICVMTALAETFHLSPLLAGMTAGAVMANSPRKGGNVVGSLDRLSPPLYAVFFAIAGSEMDFSVMSHRPALLAGGLYILSRALGKYGGVWSGAVLSGSGAEVKKYLGLAMMPHSGVTIGLLLYIQTSPPSRFEPGLSSLMVNIVLMSVFINELAGPLLSKYAITRGSVIPASR